MNTSLSSSSPYAELVLFRHTFVHTTFPLEQWQVLQSSSHLTPSGVTCPFTEQCFLVTVLNTTTDLEMYTEGVFVLWMCPLSPSKDLYLLGSGVQSYLVDIGSDIR